VNTHEPNICTINHSFSHYLINKISLDKIKYFDERLLGFGWEDNDIHYRYCETFNKNVSNIENYDLGLGHHQDNSNDINIKKANSKYSLFNKNYFFNLKYKSDPNGLLANVEDNKYRKVKIDESQYPYETYFRDNKNNL
jgi:hypothetical protein